MISTIQELKEAIAAKTDQYIFTPGVKLVFDEFLVVPTTSISNDERRLTFECNGAIFDFSNVDRGLEINGDFRIKDGYFISKGTKKMFDNTKEELGSVNGYSRFGLKVRGGSLEGCKIEIADKLGLDIGYDASTIINCDFSGTSIYYLSNAGSILNCNLWGTKIVLAGRNCSLLSNHIGNSYIYLSGNGSILTNNYIETTTVYSCVYGINTIINDIETISINNNFCRMSTFDFYTGDLSSLGVAINISNNTNYESIINIKVGNEDAVTNHGFFHVNNSSTTKVNDFVSVLIKGSNGNGVKINISSNLNELVIDSNDDLNFISIKPSLKIKSMTVSNNKGLKSLSNSGLTPIGYIELNLSGDIKEFKFSNNKLIIPKNDSCLMNLRGCKESIIIGNTFYVTGSDKILSNPGINMLVFKDNIIYSAKPFPIGLEDRYCTGFYQCVGNIIINKETV